MSKRQHDELTERRRLQDAGWDVHKRDAVAFNGESESIQHITVKLLVAKHLREQGYRIDTEVKKEGVGEIDVVAYGNDEPPFAVEIETDPTQTTVADKLDRYYRDEPFCECYILDPVEAPLELDAAREWVEDEL